MCLWTSDVTAALIELAEGKYTVTNPLSKAFEIQNKKLLKIVELVRGEMPRIHRMTLGGNH